LAKVETRKNSEYNNKITTYKQVGSLIPEVRTTVVVINNHMAVIQVQIGNTTI
jgi:hypothetical protein